MTPAPLPYMTSRRGLYIRAALPPDDRRHTSAHRVPLDHREHGAVAVDVAPLHDTPRAATLASDARDGSFAPACTSLSTSFDGPPPTARACTNTDTPYIAGETPCWAFPQRRRLALMFLVIGVRVCSRPGPAIAGDTSGEAKNTLVLAHPWSRRDRGAPRRAKRACLEADGSTEEWGFLTTWDPLHRHRCPPVDLLEWLRSPAISGSELHRR